MKIFEFFTQNGALEPFAQIQKESQLLEPMQVLFIVIFDTGQAEESNLLSRGLTLENLIQSSVEYYIWGFCNLNRSTWPPSEDR